MFQELINTLFSPHPRLTTVEDQRGSRLLSMLTLTSVVLVSLLLVGVVLTIGLTSATNTILGVVMLVIIGVLYGANRFGGFYRPSAIAFIVSFAVITIIVPFTSGARSESLAFALVPTLVTAMFFQLRAVLLVAAAVIVAAIGRILLYDGDTTPFPILLLAVAFFDGLMIVYVLHRDGIERVRRAEYEAITDELRASEVVLQERVEARTRDLQLAVQVSTQVALMRDINALLPAVVELTKEQFDLYHAHIYLYDDDRQNLMLAAGAGEAGRVMKEREHSIPVEARSLVAQAAREKRAVIVDDVKADPNFLANPLLPNTRSEAALPLMITDRVIGVIDVQSAEIARFDADLLAVLGSFSNQLAIAVENARLFSEMQRTGRQEHVLGVVSGAIQRATSLDEVLQVVARELGQALGVAETTIELRLPGASGAAVDDEQPDDVSTPAVAT